MNKAIETPVSFESAGLTLRGVLHLPAPSEKASATGVVFLHGWGGSRIGVHRMYVHAARRLALRGCSCLRFDFAGRGESDGDSKNATINTMVVDARNAASFLFTCTPVSRIVFLGICSGAKVAIEAASDDTRVTGLVLWAPEPMGYLRSVGTKAARSASMFREYVKKLARPGTWKKLVRLNINTGMVRKAMVGPAAPTEKELRRESTVLDKFSSFSGRVLFVYGTSDGQSVLASAGYKSFLDARGIPCETHEIAGANHNFYSLKWEKDLLDITEKWLEADR